VKELDLSKFFKTVLDHIIPIIIAGVVCAAITFGYCTFFATPTYTTTTTILVNNGGLSEVGPSSDRLSGNDISASLYIVNTCVGIIQSDNMYKELAKALDNKYSYYSLKGCFSAAPRSAQSLIIDINTSGTDQKEIKKIANTFLEVAPTFISNNILNVDVKILATAERNVVCDNIKGATLNTILFIRTRLNRTLNGNH
jgi:capsular polysaccharide biosynthesis protein